MARIEVFYARVQENVVEVSFGGGAIGVDGCLSGQGIFHAIGGQAGFGGGGIEVE